MQENTDIQRTRVLQMLRDTSSMTDIERDQWQDWALHAPLDQLCALEEYIRKFRRVQDKAFIYNEEISFDPEDLNVNAWQPPAP